MKIKVCQRKCEANFLLPQKAAHAQSLSLDAILFSEENLE